MWGTEIEVRAATSLALSIRINFSDLFDGKIMNNQHG
jgi:hypothetical protein